MSAKYNIGIDLGTTNCVVAYSLRDVEQPQIELLKIPQLVDAGTIEARTALPSFLYLAAGDSNKSSAYALPWAKKQDYVVGEYARRQAAEVPDRTVSAAKSWLCHGGVDRRQPVLPWGAADDLPKISPVEATQRYLEHLRSAWNAEFSDAPMAEQNVVLTVPASFDPVARELTREAALAAGLPDDLVMLEEPQAALYAWLVSIGDRWRKVLKVGQRVLVCDVGGGTTDLTLVGVSEEGGDLTLERIAVGDHLLVGGDNMDLALAHLASQKFADKKVKLDPWQSVALWHSCRNAKESLLSDGGPAKQSISVLGRGSKLIGGTVSVSIDRKSTADLLVDGFLPHCKLSDEPQRQRMSGFQEIGLPFESDTAITRHLGTFLSTHAESNDQVVPSHVLFNGGVFKGEVLRQRLIEVLSKWGGKKQTIAALEGDHDLDNSVARGAAYYGWAKERGGIRIRGGAARSYYVGIETAGLAIPGAPRPLRALCVVPFGMEEGAEVDVPSNEVGLVLGEPVSFRFFSSTTRKSDQPGNTLKSWGEEELVETDPLVATLPADEESDEKYVPVKFNSRITEVGMFELWCRSTKSDQSWKLEFSVRENEET